MPERVQKFSESLYVSDSELGKSAHIFHYLIQGQDLTALEIETLLGRYRAALETCVHGLCILTTQTGIFPPVRYRRKVSKCCISEVIKQCSGSNWSKCNTSLHTVKSYRKASTGEANLCIVFIIFISFLLDRAAVPEELELLLFITLLRTTVT